MSNTKFTPGPWEITYPQIEYKRVLIIQAKDGQYVCHISDHDFLPNINAEPNANLIASAPDMYEALKILVAVLDPMLNNPAHESVMIKAKAALSKANPQPITEG